MECATEESEYGITKGPVDAANGGDDDDEEEEEELSSDEICLEAKEVVQYTSSESSSEEDDDIREDADDSDYGGGRSKCQEMILKSNLCNKVEGIDFAYHNSVQDACHLKGTST